jgi:hypothetical protein
VSPRDPEPKPTTAPDPRGEARRRRQAAARKYQPKTIRLLLLDEAPSEDLGRYFYFEDADSIDPLFEHVCFVLFETKPAGEKVPFLKEMRRRGIFVMELKPDDPIGDADRRDLARWLPLRVEPLQPQCIIAIGPKVYEAARAELEKADLPLFEHKVPEPRGKAQVFVSELRAAIVKAGLERLIRPLPGGRTKKDLEPAEAADAEEEAPATDVPDEPPPRRPRTARARPGRPTRKGRRSANRS